MQKILSNNVDKILLVFILILAIILRFWQLWDVPFMHDEFSALFRTDFSSFKDLIDQGVRIEGHPPAIQVFLFYWVKIVGLSTFWVKLPFVLFGVVTVYFCWKIALDWFGKSSALIIALLIAGLQYFIFYSQIARPYIPGVLFVVLTVYYWKNIIKENAKIYTIILYAVFGTLSALTHHFALLQITIIGLSGLFFVTKNSIKRYLLANILLIVLYAPNLDIFFTQLSYGGIEGWLAKPTSDFIVDYLLYVTHYSTYLVVSLALVFCVGLYQAANRSLLNFKYIILSFLWFVVPFMIGYFYSVYVNAVLQFSVLIFSFPFLLFFVFGWIRNNSKGFKLFSVLFLSIAIIYSVVIERKHYSVFYNSPFEQTLLSAIDYEKKFTTDCFIVFSNSTLDTNTTSSKIFKHYADKYNFDSRKAYFIDDASQYKTFQKFLQGFKGNYLNYNYLSSANPEIFPLIQSYFPYQLETKNFYGGNAILFSKLKPIGFKNNHELSVNTIDNLTNNWSVANEQFIVDSLSDSKCYLYDAQNEWGISYTDSLFYFATKSDFIDISVDVMPIGEVKNALLVSSIEQDTSVIDWRSVSFDSFLLEPRKWNKVVHSIKLVDIKLDEYNPVLKAYIWNKAHETFLIDNFKVSIRKGNPYLYWISKKETK